MLLSNVPSSVPLGEETNDEEVITTCCTGSAGNGSCLPVSAALCDKDK